MAPPIPKFPHFRPLGLEDREVLDRGFDWLGRGSSEFSFPLFYLFRCPSGASVSTVDGVLLFRERCRGGGWCLLPPMFADRPAEAAERALRGMADEGEADAHLSAVPERMWLDVYAPGGRFEGRPDRDNFDYIYERDELAGLRGNRYHSQKNQINRFVRSHAWEYRQLDEALVDGARDLADRWCLERCELAGALSYDEVRALKEGLGLVGALGLVCGVILVDGRVEALAMGERVAPDTALIHFEKANPAIPGLAQLINREFAAREFADCRYFNRAMDLGDPGLRRAKLRYHPARMGVKYTAALAGTGLDRHFAYVHEHSKEIEA